MLDGQYWAELKLITDNLLLAAPLVLGAARVEELLLGSLVTWNRLSRARLDGRVF